MRVIDRCRQCVKGCLIFISAIAKSSPFISPQIRAASQRPQHLQRTGSDPPSPAPAQAQGLLAPKDIPHERVCLFHPKKAVALTLSDGNAGELNGFSSVWPLPFFPSLFCSLFLCRFCHLISNLISLSSRFGWFWLVRMIRVSSVRLHTSV